MRRQTKLLTTKYWPDSVVELPPVDDLADGERLCLLDGEAVMRRSITGKIRSTFPCAKVIVDRSHSIDDAADPATEVSAVSKEYAGRA